MRVLAIVYNDVVQLVKDWKTFTFMLAMPIAFTLMFGFAFADSGETSDAKLPLAFVNQDSGEIAHYLWKMLEESEVILPIESSQSRDELLQAVQDDEVAGGLIIPAGYSEALEIGKPMSLVLVVDPSSTAAEPVKIEIRTMAMRLQYAARTAIVSTQTRESLHAFTSDSEKGVYQAQSLEKALTAWESPPLKVKMSPATSVEIAAPEDVNSFDHTSPAMMAQFAIAGLMGTATILVYERKHGVLGRMLTVNISRGNILLGHYLAMFLMTLAQLVILILFAALVLDVGYFNAPLGTALLTIVSAALTAGLGLLIGVVAKKEDHVLIVSLLLMFVLAGLGGAWVPLEYTSETFQTIAKFTPLSWMIVGYENILVRGLGFFSVLPSTFVLTVFTLLFVVLAVWRFKIDEG